MRQHHHHQADKARFHHLGIIIEYRQQLPAQAQNQRDGRRQHNRALRQAKEKRFAAAARIARAKILPNKGGAGLAEGIQNVIGDNFYIKRRAGRRHNHRAQAVDGGLNDDIGNGEHRALQSGGQADAQNAPQTLPVDTQLFRLQMNFLRAFSQLAV